MLSNGPSRRSRARNHRCRIPDGTHSNACRYGERTPTLSNRPAYFSGVIEDWSGLDRTLDRLVTIRALDTSTEVGMRVQLQARQSLEHPSAACSRHRRIRRSLRLGNRNTPQQTLQDYLSTQGTISQKNRSTHLLGSPDALHRAGFAAGEIQPTCREKVRWNGQPSTGHPLQTPIKYPLQQRRHCFHELLHEHLLALDPKLTIKADLNFTSISSSFGNYPSGIDRNINGLTPQP